MICPVCRTDALIVEYKNIELDICPNCQGIWFDSGELELLLESTNLGDYRTYLEGIINNPEVKTSEKKHKCPICRRKMKKSHIDEDNKILVDICSVGDGIWFDGGEVQGLVESLAGKPSGGDASKSVQNFIGDLLKNKK